MTNKREPVLARYNQSKEPQQGPQETRNTELENLEARIGKLILEYINDVSNEYLKTIEERDRIILQQGEKGEYDEDFFRAIADAVDRRKTTN